MRSENGAPGGPPRRADLLVSAAEVGPLVTAGKGRASTTMRSRVPRHGDREGGAGWALFVASAVEERSDGAVLFGTEFLDSIRQTSFVTGDCNTREGKLRCHCRFAWPARSAH
jgi:hypothetical protein